jgi:hypothetical protein
MTYLATVFETIIRKYKILFIYYIIYKINKVGFYLRTFGF